MPPSERPESSAFSAAAIQTAIDITQGIDHLPAVATADWCDRAAAVLARLGRSATALLLIVAIDDAGRITWHEAAGVHQGRATPRAQPKLAHEVDEASLTALRARAEKLPHIGWTPERPLEPNALALSAASGRDWRAGPLGRLWKEPFPADIIAGLAPLGDAEPGRVIVVYIAAPGGAESDAAWREGVAVMRAVLPILARKALVAIGPLRTHSGHWLTAREQAVLERLVRGESNRRIAAALGRSHHTIHDHIKSLHRKLGTANRGELIARALGHLGDPLGGAFPRPPADPPGADPSRTPRPAAFIEPRPRDPLGAMDSLTRSA